MEESTVVKIIRLNIKNEETRQYPLGDVLLLSKYEAVLKKHGFSRRKIEQLSPNYYLKATK